MVRSKEDTEALVAWGKYPPLGARGITGSSIGTDYLDIAHRIPATMAETNPEVLLIAQIETVDAIDCIEEIAANPGIDVLVIGPHDLSISLGVPGDIHAPPVAKAIEKVRCAAERYGKPFGMHAAQSLIDEWTDKGMRFIMNSLDVNLLREGMRRIVEKYRTLD
jgi:2-keto-3-deoxy-L-rhamnonate aldolase RhmA